MLSLRHLDRLGDALHRLRLAARFSQAEVCARSGLRAPQLSRWENGHDVPTLESLVRFLGTVGASLADLERALLGEEDAELGVAVARELRRIRAGHRRKIAESPDLRRAVRQILRPNPEGLERRIRFP